MQMNECAEGMKPLVCVHHVVSLTWNAEVWPCHVSKYHKMVQYRGGRRLKVHAWRSSSSHSFTFQLWAPLFHCPQSLFFSFIGQHYATASEWPSLADYTGFGWEMTLNVESTQTYQERNALLLPQHLQLYILARLGLVPACLKVLLAKAFLLTSILSVELVRSASMKKQCVVWQAPK